MIQDYLMTAPVSVMESTALDNTAPGSPLYAVPQILPRVNFTDMKDVWLPIVDTKDIVLDEEGFTMPLPLHYALTQNYAIWDVFEVDRPPSATKPSGCLWSLSSTVLGQQLLTIWNTGALVAVVPESTIWQTSTDWSRTSDIDFVMVDGVRHSPLGHALRFVFHIGSFYFVLKVYIVAAANYQLLLGMSFIHEYEAALFLSWNKVVLTKPIVMNQVLDHVI